MKTTQTEVVNAVRPMETLKNLIRKGMELTGEGLAMAGEAYVEAVDNYPGFKEKFIDEHKSIDSSYWKLIEKLGRKQIHPRLMFGAGKVYSAVRKLPYSDQTIVSEKGFTLLVNAGETLKVSLDAITDKQVDQGIIRGRLASLDEQRAYIESYKVYETPAKKRVDDGAVVVRGIVEIRSHGKIIYKIDALEMNRLMNDILTGRSQR